MPQPGALDPYSAEFLYVLQQSKRLSFSRTVARMRWKNILWWPPLSLIAAFKLVDLMITNVLVRSFLNEIALLKKLDER